MRLQTKLLLSTVGLTAVTVAALSAFATMGTTGSMLAQMEQDGKAIATVLATSSNFAGRVPRQVENVIGEQMVVEARITAHMVAIAEGRAGMSRSDINAILKQITDTTVLNEFFITDEKAHAYLTNTEWDFTFDPDPVKQPQAYIFYQLLGKPNSSVIQEARPREVDPGLFKYVGVSGVDKPRIVQVGYKAGILDALSKDVNTQKLVDELTGQANVAAVRVVDKELKDIAVSAQPRGGIGAQLTEGDVKLIREAQSAREGRSNLEGNVLRVAMPIPDSSGSVVQTTLVYLSTETVQAAINDSIFRSILVALAVLAAGIAMSFFISRRITRPILALDYGAKIVGAGNLDHRLDIKTGDEIEDLAVTFNKMTADLKSHIEELKQTTAAKERIESELRVANEIQSSMLPRIFPAFPDRKEFEIYASMKPAREVGGDFYDFFFIAPNKLCFVIGDVCGKGVPAALFMAISKTLIKTEGMRDIPPGLVLTTVNDIMYPDNEASMFITCFCGILNTETGELQFANGGHTPPLLYRDGTEYRFMEIPKGFVVGAMPEIRIGTQSIMLNPNDVLFLYTDGVTEATNVRQELYSEARLKEALNRVSSPDMKSMVGKLITEIEAFAGEAPQADDITMVALRFIKTIRSGA